MFVNRLSEFEDNPAIDKTAIAIARSKSAVDRWARYLLAALAIEEDLTIDECVAAADLALAESPPPPNDHLRFLNRTEKQETPVAATLEQLREKFRGMLKPRTLEAVLSDGTKIEIREK